MSGREWVGKRVRVHSGPDRQMQYPPMAEGEVVYYIDGPSIGVRDPSGSVQAWPLTLPIEEAQ